MANDTILNDRQKQILKIIIKNGSIGRSQAELGSSRITAVRDLNGLVKLGLIKPVGRARATKYVLVETNPKLFYLDTTDYFAGDLDRRGAHVSFNHEIFDQLGRLFSPVEANHLKKTAAGFSARGRKLSPDIRRRELERFVIEFSWKSSQIEGNTYDLLETETLIKQKVESSGHSKEEAIMILNHKAAFDWIMAKRKRFKVLRLPDLLELHQLLVKDLWIDYAIRHQPVAVTGTLYRPLVQKADLEKAVRQTLKLINSTKFPPEKALLAGSLIAYIQPFTDGNKRTSRTLANAILLAHDYFPLSYRDVDANDYRRAMIIFYEQNNLYHLKQMFLEQLDFSRKNYFRI